MAGQTVDVPAPAREGDAGRRGQPGVRAGRPAARRHQGARARDGEAGGRARRRHRRRRRRASPRTRSRRRCRCSTSAAAGSAASAAGWSTRSRTSPPATWSSTSSSRSTAAATEPGDPGWGDSVPREVLVPALPPDADAVPGLAGDAARQQRRPAGAAARRQAGADGDRRAQRRPGPRPAQDPARQRPHQPQRRAAGDPGRARPRRGAAADRVLRRLAPAGQRRRRVDGRVRGRPGPQERVPPVRHQGPGRPGRIGRRRRLDPRGDQPPVPPLPRGAGRDR